MTLEGACHCNAVTYTLEWPADAQSIPARRCACSYCSRFGGTWTSHPGARLEIRHPANQPPGRYRFETGTADFLFCSVCGVVLAALDDNGGGLKAVVNILTLSGRDSLEFDHSDSHFDGEATQARLERRARNWIGRVTVSTRDAGR